jgi:hypothetical protein
VIQTLLVALLVLAPSLAAACPACLGNQRNTDVLRLIGLLMLVPFGVFALVLRAVRRAAREDERALPEQ